MTVMASSKRGSETAARKNAPKPGAPSRRGRIFAWILIILMLGSVFAAFSYVLVE